MSIRKPPGSTNWWIDIRHQGQRIRQSTGTPDQKAAQEYHDRIKAELWEQSRLDIAPAYTWDEAATRWLAENKTKKSLADDIDRMRWLDQHLAGKPLNQITIDLTETLIKYRLEQPAGGGEYQRKTQKTVSAATVNRHMAALGVVLNSAVRWGWIASAPKIRHLPEPQIRISHLTRSEACRLITELPDHLAEMAAFTLATGLRENNVLELEWRDVDIHRRVAWVHSDKIKRTNPNAMAKPLSVPLSDEAMAVLNMRKQAGDNLRFVFTYKGKPIGKCSNHAWQKARARAGLQEFHWHDLRHTWASWHVMSGTPLEVLKELGGWSDLRMVMRYAHLSAGHIASFANNMRPAGEFHYDQNLPTPKSDTPQTGHPVAGNGHSENKINKLNQIDMI